MSSPNPQIVVVRDEDLKTILLIEARLDVLVGNDVISEKEQVNLARFIKDAFPEVDYHIKPFEKHPLDEHNGLVSLSLHYQIWQGSHYQRPKDVEDGGTVWTIKIGNYSGQFVSIQDAIADYRRMGHDTTFQRFERLAPLFDLTIADEEFVRSHFDKYLFGSY